MKKFFALFLSSIFAIDETLLMLMMNQNSARNPNQVILVFKNHI